MDESKTLTDQAAPPERPWLEVLGSRHFSAWLADHNVSLAFTTYQLGKLFVVGRKVGEQFSVFERTFSRCMGLWADGPTLWMSSAYQLWRLDGVPFLSAWRQTKSRRTPTPIVVGGLKSSKTFASVLLPAYARGH